jgi:hypothetical protein
MGAQLDRAEARAQFGETRLGKVALEDALLHPDTHALQYLDDFAPVPVAANIVTDRHEHAVTG